MRDCKRYPTTDGGRCCGKCLWSFTEPLWLSCRGFLEATTAVAWTAGTDTNPVLQNAIPKERSWYTNCQKRHRRRNGKQARPFHFHGTGKYTCYVHQPSGGHSAVRDLPSLAWHKILEPDVESCFSFCRDPAGRGDP